MQSGWLWAWAVTRPHEQVAASFTALLGPSGAAAELQQMKLAVSSSLSAAATHIPLEERKRNKADNGMHDETEAGKPLGEMDAATGPNKSLGVSRKSAAAGARWAAPESSVAAFRPQAARTPRLVSYRRNKFAV